ncbi:MAG: hypothetical protein WAU25_03855, partial [Nitrososphaeraceae archaeon]
DYSDYNDGYYDDNEDTSDISVGSGGGGAFASAGGGGAFASAGGGGAFASAGGGGAFASVG